MRETVIRERETTLRDFVAVLFRRKGIILTILLVALGTLVAISATTPKVFMSTARVLVSRGEPESAYNARVKLVAWDEEVNSEIEVLTSTMLGEKAQKILNDSKAADSEGRPIEFKPGNVSAQPSGKASVLIVNYSCADPKEAREALRALVRAYQDWRGQVRSIPVIEGFFEEEIQGLRDRLTEWEQRRADFMSEEGISQLDDERGSLLRQREDASTELAREKARIADFAARRESMRNIQLARKQNADIEVAGLNDNETNDDATLQLVRRELVLRRSEYYQKLGRYPESHPEVLAARDALEELSAQYDNELENYIRMLEARIEVAQARANSLRTTVQGIDDQLIGFPDKEARLAQYDRIIEALRKDYTTVVERQIVAKVEQTGRPEWTVILLSPASEAVQLRTRDVVRLLLVPIFAVLLGLAMAFIVDGLDHSLKDATEAERHLRIPVLGSISKLR